ncbi:hypothetical protein ACLH0O_10950 [Aeromonas media]|uniref:hypothetical protein n=1 Tax=Aeromonas rivipollensis TaxID=948519 RepID=UPI0038D084D4
MAGVNELLRGLDLFVEPLGEVERLEVEGQKETSGFAHHDGLSRPVTKMKATLARPKFALQEGLAGPSKNPDHGQQNQDPLGSEHLVIDLKTTLNP